MRSIAQNAWQKSTFLRNRTGVQDASIPTGIKDHRLRRSKMRSTTQNAWQKFVRLRRGAEMLEEYLWPTLKICLLRRSESMTNDVKYLAKFHPLAQQDGRAGCFNPYRYKRSSAPQERRCGQQRKISGQIPYSITRQACWRGIFCRRQRFVYFAGARVRPTMCLAKLHSVAPCDGRAGCVHSRRYQKIICSAGARVRS